MFVSLSVLKLFVRIEVIAATQALGGLVKLRDRSFYNPKCRSAGQSVGLSVPGKKLPERNVLLWYCVLHGVPRL